MVLLFYLVRILVLILISNDNISPSVKISVQNLVEIAESALAIDGWRLLIQASKSNYIFGHGIF